MREVSKWQYKKSVRKYIVSLNRKQILEEIRGYKKLSFDDLSLEPFGRKGYFSNMSLNKARMRFRVASCYVETVRGNFSRKYRHRSLACPGCSDKNLPTTSESDQSQPSSVGPNQPQPSGEVSNQSEPSAVISNQSQPRDSQSHILLDCPAYSDLRSSLELDPMNDELLADFFTQVVQRRIENGDD